MQPTIPDGEYRPPQPLVSARTWLRFVGAFGIAFVVVTVVPKTDTSGSTPPVRMMLLVALLVAAATTGALFLTLRRDLGLPARTAIYAVAFNALIVLVKFVLGPMGLYEVNQRRALTGFTPVSDPAGAFFAAALVFLLYLAGLTIIYRLVGRRLRGPTVSNRAARRIVFASLLAALLIAASGGAILAIGLAVFGSGLEYLDFVFTSGVSFLIALALAGAASLAVMMFGSVAERERLVGNASLLATVFLIALAFLALFHVLWVVYILVITSIWPLKVIVPK